MSIVIGGLSLIRYFVAGPKLEPPAIIESVKNNAFIETKDDRELVRVGWVDWRNPLITPPDPEHMFQDKYVVFSLRMDVRTLPAALIKYHTDLKMHQLKKEKNLSYIGKETKLTLRDEVIDDLLPKTLPTPKVMEVIWDIESSQLYVTGTSRKMNEVFMESFMKSFGCEIQKQSPIILAQKLFNEQTLIQLESYRPYVYEQEL